MQTWMFAVLSSLSILLTSDAFRLIASSSNGLRTVDNKSSLRFVKMMSSGVDVKKDGQRVRDFKKNIAAYADSGEADFHDDNEDSDDTGLFLDLVQEVEVNPSIYKVSKEEEVKLMIAADVSQSDIFYEVDKKMKKTKMALIEQQKFQEVRVDYGCNGYDRIVKRMANEIIH